MAKKKTYNITVTVDSPTATDPIKALLGKNGNTTKRVAKKVIMRRAPGLRGFNRSNASRIPETFGTRQFPVNGRPRRRPQKREMIATQISKRAPRISPIVTAPKKNMDFGDIEIDF